MTLDIPSAHVKHVCGAELVLLFRLSACELPPHVRQIQPAQMGEGQMDGERDAEDNSVFVSGLFISFFL